MVKKIRPEMIVVFTLAFILISLFTAQIAGAEEYEDINKGNVLREGARSADSVYLAYVSAVHHGNINEIKKYVYSPTRKIWWDKKAREMLKATKAAIPNNVRITSKKQMKENQYNYMLMRAVGISKLGRQKTGTVKMIVENGEWKVYNEIWR